MNEEKIPHEAELFRNMVVKLAVHTWNRLPAHTKIWVSIEDLVQEGMNWIMTVGLPKWDGKKAKHSTFIHWGVSHLFFDSYGRGNGGGRGLRTKERDESRVVSFEDLRAQYDVRGKKANLDRLLKGEDRSKEIVRGCFAVPLMMKVYEEASNNLKRELSRWFLNAERFNFRTTKFIAAKREFGQLAKMKGLDINDCRHLMNSPICLDDLSRRLRWVPYDLNCPTPGLG